MIAYKRRLADVCAVAKKLSADRDMDANGESRRAAIDALECLENAKIHIEAAIRATEEPNEECGRCGGDGDISPLGHGSPMTCPVCRGSGLSSRAAAELMRG